MAILSIGINGGINAVSRVDRTQAQEAGFISNLFMRGGRAYPVKAPRFRPDIEVPHDAVQVFAYRGRRIFSTARRSYVPQFKDNREIIAWTEYGGVPQKMVEGVTVRLGQEPSGYAPVVESGSSLVPLNPKVTVLSGGVLPKGTYYIRLAFKTQNGVFPAGNEITATVDEDGSRLLSITWNIPETDLAFYGTLVFVGTESGKERYVCTADPALTRYDLKDYTASTEELASSYDQTYAYQYLTTWKRNVKGEEDESGPSPVSPLITAQAGRKITFNPWVDGTLDSPNLVDLEATTNPPTYAFVAIDGYAGSSSTNPIHVTNVSLEAGTDRLLFTCTEEQPFYDRERVIVSDGTNLFTGFPIEIQATEDPHVFAYLPDIHLAAAGAVTWTAYRSIDVKVKKCLWNKDTGFIELILEGPHTFNSGEKVKFLDFTDTGWNNAEIEILIDPLYASRIFISGKSLPKDAGLTNGVQSSWGTQHVRRVLNVLQFEHALVGAEMPIVGDVIYLKTTETPAVKTAVKVIGKVGATGFVIDGDVPAPHATNPFAVVGAKGDYSRGLCFIPHNDYVVSRGLYRVGGTAEFRLVEDVPIEKLVYVDSVSDDNLGAILSSFVTEDGVQYSYAVPPSGLQSLILHNRMGFAVEPDSNRVRCTPVGILDAWPEEFFWSFPYRPLALVSFDQACIVLCEDGLYRLDGDRPTHLQQHKCRTRHGCRAGGSAQVISNRLVYLSDDGLVLFDGQDTVPVSELKIPNEFWRGKSFYLTTDDTPKPRWPFVCPLQDAAYQRLRDKDLPLPVPPDLQPFVVGERASRHLRSFVRDGRYYLYWSTADPDTEAQTVVVMDFSEAQHAITVISLKLIDAYVDERGQIHALLPRRERGS